MIGLEVEGRPLLRAFSVASANYDEHLEFYSIKVPDGPLTSRLQHIRPGDPILVGSKPTGTLVLDHLLPGKRLYLLGTGTGLAPFMSIIRDPETYERFEHGDRRARRAARRAISATATTSRTSCPTHELVGEQVKREAPLLPDRHARAVPEPGPPHRPARRAASCRPTWACRRSIPSTIA